MSDSSLPTKDGPVRPRPRGKAPARFLPGTVLVDRYRIVAPLGRGGMGEVYRADDLKLGQPVALKFLPAALDDDPERRQRLLDEVRLARQVAHPNVCHVWDVGEVDGHDFLAMEYVDGEDLASLLRRIGRLPEDRAVRMARELCAGLAAAHDEGILHRDLKPANVMVDGRGRVKLADFGLAAVAANLEGTDVRSGTPAYMSPEQLAGREVTVRSDVYALGLVLYEIFTGRVAFPAKTLAEAAERSETPPSSPSSYVAGLDPAIERAIERCLETDPALRVVVECGGQELECHRLPQLQVVRSVDLAHAPAAERRDDPIPIGKDGPGEEAGWRLAAGTRPDRAVLRGQAGVAHGGSGGPPGGPGGSSYSDGCGSRGRSVRPLSPGWSGGSFVARYEP